MTWGLVAVAGATVVGGVIGSQATKSASNTATKAASDANALSAQYASDAQKYASDASLTATRETIQAAKDAQRENNDLSRSIYDENKAALSPYQAQGGIATRNINALLGLSPDNGEAQAAFQKYLDSTGYQFQLDEGNKNVIASQAAAGQLNSGATLKALQDRGREMAKGYFANYLDTLLGQQGTGFNAATAQTGVGTNYNASVTNQNNATANTIGNASTTNAGNLINASNNTANTNITGANNLATVRGNAALAGAANTNKFVNNLVGTAGYIYGMKG